MEHGGLDIGDVVGPLMTHRAVDLAGPQGQPAQRVGVDLSVGDQGGLGAFQQFDQTRPTGGLSYHQTVDRHQHDGTDHATHQRVVVADYGVLHHVRQQQQHHQVERVELSQVSLSPEAQQHHQTEVHGEGPQRLFGQGYAHGRQVVADGRGDDVHGPIPLHRPACFAYTCLAIASAGSPRPSEDRPSGR